MKNKGQFNFGLAVIAIGIFIFSCSSNPEDNYTQDQKDSVKLAEFIEEQRIPAYVMSQQFLNEKLKSPSTAEYPTDVDKDIVTYMGDSVFHINSYVDSQNGFGAMIRSKYNATLKFNGGDKWELVKLNLNE